ncbi:MAG: TraY domain-containing protein [Sphingomonadales bacterium]|nr:TraY domain-containing protein [Sphingomonadales bacterium]MBP7135093.1 TraY domain-containing protein [Sphingomonadaceae bacterium]MBK6491088.1 TraY domain-containing protein [Sphingomonadales bacterium]MBK6720980.1 TraY domain-containing protein [Sphingomonadales bacterium]MBK8272693.1 TraY domain-containing protein [Sphingomonadales bacterium]
MLAIRLPAQIEARLTNLAKVTGRTKSFYARQAILQHLDELEDRYVAEQRLTDLKAGRSASASLGDVLNRYGMDDRD